MGWFKSLQRASRIHEWLPSVARDADRLAEERSKATGLQLPPPDDARAGVWYTYTDDEGEVAQSALPTNVSVVILHCVGTSSFFLYVLFTSFASEALASQAFDERSSEGLLKVTAGRDAATAHMICNPNVQMLPVGQTIGLCC